MTDENPPSGPEMQRQTPPPPAISVQQPTVNQGPPYYAPPQPVYQPFEPNDVPDLSTTYLVFSILEIAFVGWILGLIPLILSILFKSAYNRGDMVEAAAKEKSTRISLIVVFIIGVLLLACAIIITIYFIVVALSIGTAMGAVDPVGSGFFNTL